MIRGSFLPNFFLFIVINPAFGIRPHFALAKYIYVRNGTRTRKGSRTCSSSSGYVSVLENVK